jgi:hypothetical protein
LESGTYHGHQLWRSLDQIAEIYEKLRTPDVAAYKEKLAAVLECVELLRQYQADEYTHVSLVGEQQLNQVNAHLASVQQNLANLLADTPNWGHLDNAYNLITQNLVPYVQANLPAPPPPAATPAAKRAFTMEVNRLTAEVERLMGLVQQTEVDRSATVSGLEARLSDLDNLAQQTSGQVKTLATELRAQIDQQRSVFASEANERVKSFADEVASREATAKEALAEISKTAHAEHEDQLQRARLLVKDLDDFRATSESLVDDTSRNAIAGDYGAWAVSQGNAARWWTVATVLMGTATAGVLIYLLNHDSSDSLTFTLYKTGISVVMLIVAGYCASQAAEHRREERTAKRLHLDLAALEPFLKQVKEPEELRTQIALRVFAPSDPGASDSKARSVTFGRGLSVDQLVHLVDALKGSGPPGGAP